MIWEGTVRYRTVAYGITLVCRFRDCMNPVMFGCGYYLHGEQRLTRSGKECSEIFDDCHMIEVQYDTKYGDKLI